MDEFLKKYKLPKLAQDQKTEFLFLSQFGQKKIVGPISMRETKETVANPSSQSHEVPSPENSAKFQGNFTKDKEAKLLYKLLTSESNGIYI